MQDKGHEVAKDEFVHLISPIGISPIATDWRIQYSFKHHKFAPENCKQACRQKHTKEGKLKIRRLLHKCAPFHILCQSVTQNASQPHTSIHTERDRERRANHTTVQVCFSTSCGKLVPLTTPAIHKDRERQAKKLTMSVCSSTCCGKPFPLVTPSVASPAHGPPLKLACCGTHKNSPLFGCGGGVTNDPNCCFRRGESTLPLFSFLLRGCGSGVWNGYFTPTLLPCKILGAAIYPTSIGPPFCDGFAEKGGSSLSKSLPEFSSSCRSGIFSTLRSKDAVKGPSESSFDGITGCCSEGMVVEFDCR